MLLALIAGRLTHIITTTASRIHVLRVLWLEWCFILVLFIVKLLNWHWHWRLLISLLAFEVATTALVVEVVLTILVITILPSMILMRHLVATCRWRIELRRLVHVTLMVIVTST